MTTQDLATANALQATINNITAAQAKIALSGSRVHLRITSADGSQELLSPAALSALITGATYDSICATAKTSISTDLGTAKSTAQSSFDALDAGS